MKKWDEPFSPTSPGEPPARPSVGPINLPKSNHLTPLFHKRMQRGPRWSERARCSMKAWRRSALARFLPTTSGPLGRCAGNATGSPIGATSDRSPSGIVQFGCGALTSPPQRGRPNAGVTRVAASELRRTRSLRFGTSDRHPWLESSIDGYVAPLTRYRNDATVSTFCPETRGGGQQRYRHVTVD